MENSEKAIEQLSGRVTLSQKEYINQMNGSFSDKLAELIKSYETRVKDNTFNTEANKTAIHQALNVIVNNMDTIEINARNYVQNIKDDIGIRINNLEADFTDLNNVKTENEKLSVKNKEFAADNKELEATLKLLNEEFSKLEEQYDKLNQDYMKIKLQFSELEIHSEKMRNSLCADYSRLKLDTDKTIANLDKQLAVAKAEIASKDDLIKRLDSNKL